MVHYSSCHIAIYQTKISYFNKWQNGENYMLHKNSFHKKKNLIFKKHIRNTVMITSVLSLLLTGCGSTEEEKELADFSSSISDFTSAIQQADSEINELDVSKEDAVEDLLAILDTLDSEFQDLAELSVPEQYHSIESLADEASENMTTAVSYFHSAYEAETFNEQDADIAYQYYTRAMTRIEYIGYVLVGEIPENDRVTVYEESNDRKLIEKILQDEEVNETEDILEGSVVSE